MIKVGTIQSIWLYPVKSMRGISVESADMYWYGLEGDRRYAYVQSSDHTTFPWLTGREVPKIVQYQPTFSKDDKRRFGNIEVITPEGKTHTMSSSLLRQELATQFGKPVHLMQLNRGAFDAAPMSIISTATLQQLSQTHGSELDLRRFRINVIIEAEEPTPYVEDSWIDGSVTFGAREDSAVILPFRPIQRCVMVNIDPDSAEKDAGVLKSVNRSRNNFVGVYSWPRQIGTLRKGDTVYLRENS
ncbi:MAG: MOSC N-terminal beta barrel domain-containing protein [Chloroflexota bacterium]